MTVYVEEAGENSGKKISVVKVTGRIDTTNAFTLETRLCDALKEIPDVLQFDFSDLEYLTSAGLRVILSVYKKVMAAGKEMMILNVNDSIWNVFKMTGFLETMTIKKGNADGE